ncbi:MAG TPA: hypothetical protein PLM75_03275 [bacterium]|nr:hypothetical protein [bacterium]
MKETKIYYLIAFLVSFCIIFMQLLLSRIFSVVLWYHFAFMSVSIAMLGISCAGIYIYYRKSKIIESDVKHHLFFAALIAPLYLFFTYYLIFNSRIFLKINIKDLLYLGFIYFHLMMSFFFLGYCITLLITFYSKNISRLYFFDLIGAAAGCIVFIPTINKLGAENTILFLMIIMAFIPLLISLFATKLKSQIFISLLVLIAAVGLFKLNSSSQHFRELFKIKYVKGHPERELEFSKWNAFSRVGVYGLRFIDWGLSPKYKIEKLTYLKTLDIDACAGMIMVGHSDDTEELEFLKHSITALAYLIKPEGPMAVIGAGAGKDVLAAKLCGVNEIYAVDINPIIYEVVNNYYGKFTNYLYSQPGIKFEIEDGRSFVRRLKNKFKIIQVSMVDTWAAINSGAMALAENTLYTVEAFIDYFNSATDDGIVTFTRFYYRNKPRESLRTLSIALEAFNKLNIKEPYRNIIIIANILGENYNTITFLFKKTPFTIDEITRAKQIADENGFVIEYIPSGQKIEPNHFTNLIFSQNRKQIYKNYEFDISPTTDDRPFFFHLLKPTDFLKAINFTGRHQYNYIAVFVLVVSFIIIFFMTVIFVITPLIIKIHQNYNDFNILNILAYFACLGAGFMVIETSLIQRYILLLGHPIYSLSVILFSMLIFSGIGSFLTSYFKDYMLFEYVIKVFIMIIIVLVIYNLIIDSFFEYIIGLDQPHKILIAVFTLMAPSLLLGMPAPLAIRILTLKKAQNIIPWCWAINGAFSVLGSLFAFILAMNLGFKITLYVAIFIYACAMFMSIYLKQKLESSE